jgi:hypothetical protein
MRVLIMPLVADFEGGQRPEIKLPRGFHAAPDKFNDLDRDDFRSWVLQFQTSSGLQSQDQMTSRAEMEQ